MKEKFVRYLVRSSKICTVQKSSFFHCEEYMEVKIMSRVLDGFGETADQRGRTRIHGHGFLERLPHKSPFGPINYGAPDWRFCTFLLNGVVTDIVHMIMRSIILALCVALRSCKIFKKSFWGELLNHWTPLHDILSTIWRSGENFEIWPCLIL